MFSENTTYEPIAFTDDHTVVSEYIPEPRVDEFYQSEAKMEDEFIKDLKSQGYEYIEIKKEEDLILNLRKQIEILNKITFTEKEWNDFFSASICPKNESIDSVLKKTRRIQEDYIQVLKREDGTVMNIVLIDKKEIHNNRLQVMNQYEVDGVRKNIYDVTVLVNGLPLVHIELKKRGVDLKQAFDQIRRYGRESFGAFTGIFDYVQIFVISNGTLTKYYSNTTREQHINLVTGKQTRKTSNSFEFTSTWADAENRSIEDIKDFTKTFFQKNTIFNILTKYCVFTAQDVLIVLRPYQIVAAERILQQISIADNYNYYGSVKAGGYIWHTTGSGKTLTSFKTARLACEKPEIDKVIFVVDRKDLDYQTQLEYDKYEKGSADSSTSTSILKKHLDSPESKIIITTIQKLDRFIKSNPKHPIYDKKVVMIFDECHRSQFGNMHTLITRTFKKYYIFGFTGTPIFTENALEKHRTTDMLFGTRLHTYTVVDAIADRNVLRFKVDYVNTITSNSEIEDKKISGIDKERAFLNPQRIQQVTEYILKHFDDKTRQNKGYTVKGNKMSGFNSILAASSIEMAKMYYTEFKRQIKESGRNLKIATIYSFTPNEEEYTEAGDSQLEAESLDKPSRDFLEDVIKDYNKMFSSNYSTSGDQFQNYYKDLSLKVKEKQIDILIVVNIFLTGFDATTLNTLWVDKYMQYHGLIQAFSRTNRILNAVKTHGNIVVFRNLQEEVDKALALFGNRDAKGIVILKNFSAYYDGYEEGGEYHEGYMDIVNCLQNKFPPGTALITEEEKREFIEVFGKLLRSKNFLETFNEFHGKEVFSDREFQDYQSRYIDAYQSIKAESEANGGEDITGDLRFEPELVKQINIDINYILLQVKKYYVEGADKEYIVKEITRIMDSTIELRSKKELIAKFIREVSSEKDLDSLWEEFVEKEKNEELNKIIEEKNLKPAETDKYVDKCLQEGSIIRTGPDLDEILPAVRRFGKPKGDGPTRNTLKGQVTELLTGFIDKFKGIFPL